jgi:hypothetical protein
MPCLSPGCPWWKSTGTDPLALDPDVQVDRLIVKKAGSA